MDECSNLIYDETGPQSDDMGQSDSKGARKRSKTPSGHGAAMSFGFRKNKGSKSKSPEPNDKNGNGGSTEELCTGSPVLSGRSTPLARPRKDNSAQPLRTNRFGFRQTAPKTAKVADVNMSAEQALTANCETKNNNHHEYSKGLGLIPTQSKKQKQTVILTYAPKQQPIQRSKSPAVPRVTSYPTGQRSASASRAPEYGSYGRVGKYTLQTTQLPKPQYPVRVLDTKSAKQVANNSKKVYGSSDGSSKEGSATEDSGVSGLGDKDSAWSPIVSRRLHRRPRTLEMIMHGDHNFHLRELHLNDLDIMDEAIVTDTDVIPLPKLPSTFDKERHSTTDYFQQPENRVTLGSGRSNSSIMDRGREATIFRSSSDAEDLCKGEEKASRDRVQHEKCEKRDYGKLSQRPSPQTSKESSPKSDDPSVASSVGDQPWTAGESMALRDDISSISSSCDDDKRPNTVLDINTDAYASLTTHPMMMKSLSLSQHQALPGMLTSMTMTASAFTDSSSLVGLRISNLNSSNHSLIEDETSPADSLISSSTDSNNDMPVLDRDATVSTSAYHTADNKTLAANNSTFKDDDTFMEDNLKDKEKQEKSSPSKKSPRSPDTPTNASNSLSLSEGRDFLIDDEIADQPALIFEANSTADQATSSLQLLHLNTDTPTLLETLNQSNMNKIKGITSHKNSSPKVPKRSPSLDTLSPCDSIASDDLMMDMDMNNSITSLNSVDEYIDRLDGSIRSGLNSLEDKQLRDELLKLSFRKYSSQALNESVHGTPKATSASQTCLTNLGTPLPVRTGRLLSRSRAGTPESPLVAEAASRASSMAAVSSPGGSEDALRLERSTHGNMLHDIVTIKTMLLKLKRVLQEPDEEHNLLRTETHNPLDSQRDTGPLKNGPSLRLGEIGEASPPPLPQAPQEEVADLRRQLVFLQSQLEDREKLVKLLQHQMSKYSENQFVSDSTKMAGLGNNSEEMCNVATQTDRLRPTQGSSILQGLSSDSHLPGSIVSWNEPNRSRSIQSPCNHRQSSSSPTLPNVKRHLYSTVQINGGDHLHVNGKTNGHSKSRDVSPRISAPGSPVYIKSNCRVGSKYMQAITNNNGLKHCNGDRKQNRPLYARSKSIENFRSHEMSVIDFDESPKRGAQQNGKMHHHKSHSNLLNDCSEDNSDSGYKSLPPSVNKTSSGIPRRTLSIAQSNKC